MCVGGSMTILCRLQDVGKDRVCSLLGQQVGILSTIETEKWDFVPCGALLGPDLGTALCIHS